MINLLEKLLNLIYIQPCYFCRSTKEDSLLCSKCHEKIKFYPLNTAAIIADSNVYACTFYEGIIKNLIISLKYYNKKRLAYYAAKIMYEYWQKLNINKEFLIIPVPIHKNRRKERKYNHMELTADEFAKLTGYSVNKNFLIREKDTLKQYNLHKQERIENIKNAFVINKNVKSDKNTNILILDDITSTGATLNEIIKLLKENGYVNITALCLATPDIFVNK